MAKKTIKKLRQEVAAALVGAPPVLVADHPWARPEAQPITPEDITWLDVPGHRPPTRAELVAEAQRQNAARQRNQELFERQQAEAARPETAPSDQIGDPVARRAVAADLEQSRRDQLLREAWERAERGETTTFPQ